MRRHLARAALLVLAVAAGPALAAQPASAENAPNGFPYCVNGASTDPDGDGWGWENNQSCVVRGGRADTGGGGGGGSAACPGSAGSSGCGSYTVGGLGARKRAITAAGGDAVDLAVAMLETDTMTTNYPYGDNKSGDAANFGVFKQNWYMLRNACSRFSGQPAGNYNNGAVLNSNLGADVQCLNASQNFYGIDRWFAGHRNGQSGLSNPNTADINRYRTAVNWIRDRITANSANLTNDTRFWVNVPAI